MDLIGDIFYQKKYASLYVKEEESIFEFLYKEDEKYFYNISIKRPICKIGSLDIKEGYFDLETAYGYGGYLTNSNEKKFIITALTKYANKCREENIIAEFFRFHPYNNFPVTFGDFFDFLRHDRDIVVVNLQLSKEERWSGYSKTTRNILRKCQHSLSIKNYSDIATFKKIYYETMKRNNANEFFFFDDQYFKNLLAINGVYLLEVKYGGSVVSSSFFLALNSIVYYHLSANDHESSSVNGNYFLLDSAFDIFSERNFKYMILGGGTTSLPNDSLLRFKRKFSKEAAPFFIAGKIYNHEIYQKYIDQWESQRASDVNYFFKYRL